MAYIRGLSSCLLEVLCETRTPGIHDHPCLDEEAKEYGDLLELSGTRPILIRNYIIWLGENYYCYTSRMVFVELK